MIGYELIFVSDYKITAVRVNTKVLCGRFSNFVKLNMFNEELINTLIYTDYLARHSL